MSITNDSEDWLDAAIEEALPKALRVVYSSNLKRKLLKDAVLAHYAHYLKPEDVEHAIAEAEQRGMRKVLDLKKARPCPACNDISLIPNDDLGTICVKCKATYPF